MIRRQWNGASRGSYKIFNSIGEFRDQPSSTIPNKQYARARKKAKKDCKKKKKNRKHRRKRQRRGSKDEKNSTSKRFRQPFARHYLHDRLPSPLSLAFLFFHFYCSPAPLSLVNTRPDERTIFNRPNEFPRANCPRIWQLELGHESYTQRMPDISLNFHRDAFKFQGNGSRCLSANPVVLIADISLAATRDKVPRGLGYCKIYRPIRFHLAEFCSKRMDGGSQVSGCEEFPRVDFALIFTIFRHRCRELRISTVLTGIVGPMQIIATWVSIIRFCNF